MFLCVIGPQTESGLQITSIVHYHDSNVLMKLSNSTFLCVSILDDKLDRERAARFPDFGVEHYQVIGETCVVLNVHTNTLCIL